MKRIDKFGSSKKKEWWGDGEWVNEPDIIQFEHFQIKCEIIRVAIEEPHAKEFFMFGGHLCGYIEIPIKHPFYQKKFEDIPIEVHGGLTFDECPDSHWIGFDCAHCYDYIPSMEFLKKKYNIDDFFPIPEELKKYSLFNPIYRNMEFVIEECKKMSLQIHQLNVE